ncbi:hypothetical protein [Ochrobactrum sp. SFR4]|uniref:hypothetical protein n=1 Tax=Ochrobactrum sp. SFR4 TaxID=2717368 RepID=UPI000EFB6B7F|nr:hypothetical protein [Ochrobactrum sp. SFR4]MBX8824455.1 hypothetical protein [Ochrobactrum sp. SFR4]
MNAKTEKRLGIMAALLLTAAIFVAPNPIQQQQKFHFLSMTEEAVKDVPALIVVAQNTLTGKIIR